MSGSSSTIWAQLSNPLAAANSIPFVLSDNITISTDVANFSYNGVTHKFYLTNQITYSYSVSTTPGSTVTTTTASGRIQLSAGQATITMTNALIGPNTIVHGICESSDATALYIKKILPTTGSVAITMNTTATATVNLAFVLVN